MPFHVRTAKHQRVPAEAPISAFLATTRERIVKLLKSTGDEIKPPAPVRPLADGIWFLALVASSAMFGPQQRHRLVVLPAYLSDKNFNESYHPMSLNFSSCIFISQFKIRVILTNRPGKPDLFHCWFASLFSKSISNPESSASSASELI